MRSLQVPIEGEKPLPHTVASGKTLSHGRGGESDGICVAHRSSTRPLGKNSTQTKKIMHFLPTDFLLDATISNNRNIFQEAASNSLDCVQRTHLSADLHASDEAMKAKSQEAPAELAVVRPVVAFVSISGNEQHAYGVC
jgi:hypothetical protein